MTRIRQGKRSVGNQPKSIPGGDDVVDLRSGGFLRENCASTSKVFLPCRGPDFRGARVDNSTFDRRLSRVRRRSRQPRNYTVKDRRRSARTTFATEGRYQDGGGRRMWGFWRRLESSHSNHLGVIRSGYRDGYSCCVGDGSRPFIRSRSVPERARFAGKSRYLTRSGFGSGGGSEPARLEGRFQDRIKADKHVRPFETTRDGKSAPDRRGNPEVGV